MKILVTRDGEWYLASVEWIDNLYAYGDTPELAKKELLGVVEMMMDYHLEMVEKERRVKNEILNSYAL